MLVIPSNSELNMNFHVFDKLVEAINQARRAARDFVTDHSLEKTNAKLYGEGKDDRDWVV